MQRSIVLIFLLALASCQSRPDDEDGRFYSYVDAQGNLVTVEERPDGEGTATGSAGGAGPDGADGQGATGGDAGGKGRADSASDRIDAEDYQTPAEARARMQEQVEADERDRFISYIGPEGEVINRPLDLVAEREAAEQGGEKAYESLPGPSRYKETTSRIPADCCRHLVEEAGRIERGMDVRLGFDGHQGVRLDRTRPARILRLGRGVGELEIRSFIRKGRYLAPRLLVLNREGTPVLKVNSIFTRHYPENWARYAYVSGRLERRPEFAYVVFYLPYAVIGEDGVRLDPALEPGSGEFRRGLDGDLALTARRGPPGPVGD